MVELNFKMKKEAIGKLMYIIGESIVNKKEIELWLGEVLFKSFPDDISTEFGYKTHGGKEGSSSKTPHVPGARGR